MGRRLTALAERMADFNVRMGFHQHIGTIVETDAEVGLLMGHTGAAVGLLYDTGHSAFSGGDPVAMLKANISRFVHVHCKDTRQGMVAGARAADMSVMAAVMDGIFTVSGDGSIDYVTILKMFCDAGYAGWLVVEAEQDPKKTQPLIYATMGFQNLAHVAKEAGFTVTS